MEGEIKNLVEVWLSILASLCYCYFLASKIPKGKLRLFAFLPIFFIFTILPFSLSYVFPIALTALFISWLGNFKLLLFAFDKGPLSSHQPPNSFIHFFLNCSLPIKIKENGKYPSPQTPQSPPNSSPKHPKLPLNWPTKVLLFAVLVGANDHKHGVQPKIVLLVYCFMVYLLIDIIFGISNGLVRATTGLELEPPSDEPYLSTSLQDFWGKRWNLMVTNLLRHTIYKPVRSISDMLLGSKLAPFPAVIATFLVSGLMHELFLYYIIRVSPTWELTWYFVLHGACMVVELALKRMFSSKFQLHWAVSTPLTVGFVVATALWLFFPPLLRSGAVDRALEECKVLLDFAMLALSKAKGVITH
ncbi:hypothetical protein DITRI_Ditri01bG0188500 [Diplodiscus trichospermus]